MARGRITGELPERPHGMDPNQYLIISDMGAEVPLASGHRGSVGKRAPGFRWQAGTGVPLASGPRALPLIGQPVRTGRCTCLIGEFLYVLVRQLQENLAPFYCTQL